MGIQKGEKILGIIVVILIIALAIIFSSISRPEEAVTITDTSSEVADRQYVVQLSIDFGDDSVLSFSDLPIQTNQNLFSALEVLDSNGLIDLEFEDFGDELGVFINSINGVGGDDTDRWWQYWVNDVYAEVGMSNYTLQPDDQVLVKFSEGQI